jgi:hypothetical protein
MMTSLSRFLLCVAFISLAKVCEANGPNHATRLSLVKHWEARPTVFFDEQGPRTAATSSGSEVILRIRGGGWIIPAGYNPFGYKITPLGEQFLSYDGSLDCDVGRFVASLKARKRFATLKGQWLEVVRVSKTGQTMRIYKNLQNLVKLCLKMGLID